MKGKTKQQKGITLIALLVTVVVLTILAAVAIAGVKDDGIIAETKENASDFEIAQEKENLQRVVLSWSITESDTLVDYFKEKYGDDKVQANVDESITVEVESGNRYVITEEGEVELLNGNGNGNGSGGTIQTVTTVKNTVLSTTANTDVYDEYGNKMVVPAGFKIRVDSTTNNADTVTEGIVIEDENGNQFVWIPVGKIYTDTAKTEVNAKTITLGRYDFSTTGEPSAYSGSYTEDTVSSHNSSYGNAIARDIEAFITSANTKGGYYLGRYEARKNSNGDLTTVSTDTVWNAVNQATASSESKGMYVNGYNNGTFSSDLINSYAWDTAIVFLQTFDNRTDKTIPYSRQTSLNSSFSTTGTTTDIICNVYDMIGNCQEWSTETSSDSEDPCVQRGTNYASNYAYTCTRNDAGTGSASVFSSFRPLLYVGL